MSRYPFEEYANKFMSQMAGIYADETWVRRDRRFKRIARDLQVHFTKKKISTTSPLKMTVDDIKYHLTYRRNLGYSTSEYAHEVSSLIQLFDFCKNMSLRSCLVQYPLLKPVSKNERLESMTEDEYDTIVSMASDSVGSTYERVRAYAMVSLFLGCGCRNKELRLSDINHLNTTTWILDIVHVKGEKSYGHSRFVPVPPIFRTVIIDYLRQRKDNNPNGSKALFPPSRGSNDYLVGNSVRKILSLVTDETGVVFNARKCRRTFGQVYLDNGIKDGVEVVSVLMGHSTTKTTETFYARRRNDTAVLSALSVWEKQESKELNSEPEGKMVLQSGFEPECRPRKGRMIGRYTTGA